MTRCLCCQRLTADETRYHPRCLKTLFGTNRIPGIPFAKSDLAAEVSRIQGRMSLSGVQIKASVLLEPKAKQLEIVAKDGTHILKPEPDVYEELPLAENLCMNIAGELGMSIPPHGLFPMVDGKLCYIVKRFDRLADGTKLPMETMYQILESEDKYKGSLESVGKAIRQHATNVGLASIDFFERVLLCYLIGNGDMHLKNWALLQGEDAEWDLSPCYDLVSSRLYLPGEDDSALTLRGKKNRFTRDDFMALSENLQIDSRAAENSIDKLRRAKNRILGLLQESELNSEMQVKMEGLIRSRYEQVLTDPLSREP